MSNPQLPAESQALCCYTPFEEFWPASRLLSSTASVTALVSTWPNSTLAAVLSVDEMVFAPPSLATSAAAADAPVASNVSAGETLRRLTLHGKMESRGWSALGNRPSMMKSAMPCIWR